MRSGKVAGAFGLLGVQRVLRTFFDPKDLAVAVGTDANGHQYRDVAHLARAAALEKHPFEVPVGKLTHDLAIAPGLDVDGRSSG